MLQEAVAACPWFAPVIWFDMVFMISTLPEGGNILDSNTIQVGCHRVWDGERCTSHNSTVFLCIGAHHLQESAGLPKMHE